MNEAENNNLEFTVNVGDEVIVNGAWAKVEVVDYVLEEACVVDEDGEDNWVSFDEIDEL
jgi:hypothetical protein